MLKKIVNKFGDKTVHVWAGIFNAVLSGMLLYIFVESYMITFPVFGFVMANLAGALKELVYDKLMKKGQVSAMDFWATFYGALVGAILVVMSIGVIEKLG